MSPKHWHQLGIQDALNQLDTQSTGLNHAEVLRRQALFGANRLTPPQPPSALLRFARQFHNILIYVLLASATITGVLGHIVDTFVIVGVTLINALIGFIQEGKAERSLDALRDLLSPKAQVIRDGKLQDIEASTLVPGDIVQLSAGDRVPADLRLLEQHNLRIDESALTGESVPVTKDILPLAPDTSLADRQCMAYSGTLAVFGQGRGVVTEIGDATQIGQIGAMLKDVQGVETPLIQQMNEFARKLSFVVFALAIATVLFGMFVHGQSAAELFLPAVGLAVAAIPEGLPAVMTIALAIGVRRMATRHAIIRHMPAVEALGSVTTICSDKTGTLTKNEMTAQKIVTTSASLDVSGVGYNPSGTFSQNGKIIEATALPELTQIAKAALLCNDATLSAPTQPVGAWQLTGDPTEGALISLALKCGLDQQLTAKEYPRDDVIPFEAEHRFMATLHHDHAGHRFAYLKGAPEQLLKMCTKERTLGIDQPIHLEKWQREINALGCQGFRLIALAFKALDKTTQTLSFGDVESGLTLLALIAISDPPRPEAMAAIVQCKHAGIHIKMITGDHAQTALSIAHSMGIETHHPPLTGLEIDAMDDTTLQACVRNTTVFARTNPEHKLRLVKALQANREITAMTGDGVNDAPALKQANIGIAMGHKGTEAAKEAAAMVLTDDNFASIVAAVEEGRRIYDNLRKTILFILPTSFAQAAMVIAAVISGTTLPITPVQILWINMVTATTLSLAIAFETGETNLMARPPRASSDRLADGFMFWRVSFVTLLMVAISFSLFTYELTRHDSLAIARTTAVNSFSMCQVAYLLSCRQLLSPALQSFSLKQPLTPSPTLISISLLIALQLLQTYLPLAQTLFGTAAIDLDAWLRVSLGAGAMLLAIESEKYLLRKRFFGRY